MSSFQDLDETCFHNNPEAEAQRIFVQSAMITDKESLFYADCAKILWASASGLL